MNDLFRTAAWIWSLRHPESWIKKQGGFTLVSAIAVFIAIGAYYILELSAPVVLYAVAASWVIGFIIWFAGRELYWMVAFGKKKVGIAYSGYKVPFEEWLMVRKKMNELLEGSLVKNQLALRIIPPYVMLNKKNMAYFQKKYDFGFLIEIKHSFENQTSSNPVLSVNFQSEIKKAIDESVWKAAQGHFDAIASKYPKPSHTYEILEFQAGSLFDILLFAIGVMYFCKEDCHSCSIFLEALDDRLSSRFPYNEQPRRAIRYLISLSLVRLGNISIDHGSVPVADDMIARKRWTGEAVLKYGSEFPFILNQHARTLFFIGDLEGALDLVNRADQLPLQSKDKVRTKLNLAVLNLLLSRPDTSRKHFDSFLVCEELDDLDWSNLVEFADYALDEGYENAILLCVIYREYSRKPVSSDLKQRLSRWIKEDRSRNVFYDIISKFRNVGVKDKMPLATAGQKRRKKKNRKS